MKRIAFYILLAVAASPVSADVLVGNKHLVILKPGLDAIWGNYIFAIQNDGDSEQSFVAPVMLPKETVDYQPQEGISPDDLRLTEDGIAIEKSFPPGLHIISIAFRTDARLGKATLTFVPPGDVPDFTLLLPNGEDLTVAGGPLVQSPESPDPAYEAWRGKQTFVKRESVEISIAGVPEGRTRYWAIGSVVGGLLILLAGFFAWRSRPKLKDASAEGLVMTD